MDAEDTKLPVRTELRNHTLWIWIDREERRNAINKGVIAGIEERRGRLPGRCRRAQHRFYRRRPQGVLRRRRSDAAAPQTFTLGLDEPMTDFGKLARVMRDLGVPVIGRINGDCVAGGMGLMALCDLAVVADHARFGLPEAKVGVFPMQVLVFCAA